MKSHNSLIAVALAAAAAGLLLTSCSAADSTEKQGDPSDEDLGQKIGMMPLDGVEADQEATALLPEGAKGMGKLTVAMDLHYPPTSFKDAGSDDALGFNSDFARLVGKKLGLDVEIKNIGFDTIIPSIDSGRIDMTTTSMTPTEERLEKLDMIPYYEAGSSLLVAKGNPDDLDINDTSVCGAKISVTKGSSQADEHVPAITEKCEAAGKPPVDVVVLPNVQDALTQLNSKRISGAFEDTPLLAWAELQQPERFQMLTPGYKKPTGDDITAVGLKKDPPLTPAVLKTIEHLVDTDEYKEALSRWGLEGSEITSEDVNQK